MDPDFDRIRNKHWNLRLYSPLIQQANRVELLTVVSAAARHSSIAITPAGAIGIRFRN